MTLIRALSFINIFIFFISCNNISKTPSTVITSPPVKETTPEYQRSEGKIKYGQTLQHILYAHDIDRNDVAGIINAFSDVFNVKHLKPHKQYCILTDSLGTIQGFEYIADREKIIRVTRKDSTSFAAKSVDIPLMKRTDTITGFIETSLYDAIRNLGETPELIIAFSDVFQWDIDFFIDPRHGDEFRIVFEKFYLQDASQPDSVGEFVRYGKILAGEYNLDGQPLTAYYFDNHPKDSGYYDKDGKSFQKTFLKSPLNYRRISSFFSAGRRHPILKIVRPHYAIDYAATTGTPISASANGTVIDKDYNKGIGNFIKIRHKNSRYVTLYGHMSRFAKGIHKGSRVKQRDVIGYVGQTGLATGPHLHYAFYDNGRPINPMKIKNTSGDPIDTENMTRFAQVKQDMSIKLQNATYFKPNSPYAHMRPTSLGLGRVGLPEK